MTPSDVTTIDAACRVIREVGKQRGYDITIYLKHDGRVFIVCENLAGHVKDQAHGDVEPGSAHPPPGEALLKLAERLAQ